MEKTDKKRLADNLVLHRRMRRCDGFVALFFVLTIASFLTMLVYGLSRSLSYTLTMLDSFRNTDRARSSALYCKYKLFNATMLDIEYEPVLGVDVPTPLNSACTYRSFRRVDASVRETVISSRLLRIEPRLSPELYPAPVLQDFTIKYTYSVNNALHDYVQDIQSVQIH
jgi:hypothetical protein